MECLSWVPIQVRVIHKIQTNGELEQSGHCQVQRYQRPQGKPTQQQESKATREIPKCTETEGPLVLAENFPQVS